jgi:Zn-dependent protease with chaperone function
MDYFHSQDVARRKTGLLVFYFALAVILIILSVYLAIQGVLSASETVREGQTVEGLSGLWNPELFAWVALGTSSLIAGGSLYKIAALSGGGHTVAELLGGRLLHPDSANPEERRLLNIVEEMAIASGLPVPPVYLLENESGINAFAAGHAPGDAVVAVTTGCLRALSRDELQGVIAHEFSHILNGDMRLNLRLMGVLFGILVIGLTGWLIFRSTANASVNLNARSDDDDRKKINPIPLIGLALYLIGYVGVFFGNLIKAAVSRQREFLADASAVQFTRNPQGIAGALKKIGALSEGSHIQNPHAEEASHMFFGNAVGGLGQFFGLLATHPPLVERIRRLDPSFSGDFSEVRLEQAPEPEHAGRREQRAVIPFTAAQAIAQVGTIDRPHLTYAAALKASLPRTLTDAVREPLGAQAVVFALLFDPDESVRRTQLSWLQAYSLPAAVHEARKVQMDVQRLVPEARLPLVELAAPALCQMTAAQFHDFFRSIEALVEADQKISLFEYALQRLLIRRVVTHFVGSEPSAVKYTSFPPLVKMTAIVLSALADAGDSSRESAFRAFAAGCEALHWPDARLDMAPESSVGLRAVDTALVELATAAPLLKKQILEACAACICIDGHITVEEGELLRAISDCLGCPMPPLIASSDRSSAPILNG